MDPSQHLQSQTSESSTMNGIIIRSMPSLRRLPTHKDVELIVDDNDDQVLNTDDDGRPKRTGTYWTASAHIVTAVIGSGVLSLSWSMSKLGWIAGPLVLLTFATITYFTALLLADCYRTPPSSSAVNGAAAKRNYTYVEAVRSSLGGRNTKFCAIIQYTNLVGTAIGFTITASISMVAVARSNCFHKHGHDALCFTSTYPYMLLFGGVQLILSQIPTFSKLWWLSIVAAVMSFSYASIGVGLGIGKVAAADGHIQGTLGGYLYKKDGSPLSNIRPIFQALGNIAFAYSYSMILIEIQDTLKAHPSESQTMKKANLLGISITTIFYLLCGGVGYAVFGNDAPGNLLTGFGYFEPYWLIDIANVCVVAHLVGAFQVFAQPLFAFIEERIAASFPKSQIVHKHYPVKIIPFYGSAFRINLLRLASRTGFVTLATLASMLLPFFNDILGILGALAFWPLTVYFPVEMHIANSKIQKWSWRWLFLEGLSLFCLLISMAALVGSIGGVIKDLLSYKPFEDHP